MGMLSVRAAARSCSRRSTGFDLLLAREHRAAKGIHQDRRFAADSLNDGRLNAMDVAFEVRLGLCIGSSSIEQRQFSRSVGEGLDKLLGGAVLTGTHRRPSLSFSSAGSIKSFLTSCAASLAM